MNRNPKKSTVVKWLVLFCTILVIASCVHELPLPAKPADTTPPVVTPPVVVTPPPVTPPVVAKCSADTVYFSTAVLPLVVSLCGKSGCHATRSPQMTNYSNINSALGTSSKLTSKLNNMAGQNKSGYVAPDGTQLATLQKWISQGAKNNACTISASNCDTTNVTYSVVIAPILSTYCKSCHTGASGGGGVDLSTVAAIQSEITKNPGRLLGSIQWTAPYNTTTTAMPLSGSQIPPCYISQIKKWISSGALNN